VINLPIQQNTWATAIWFLQREFIHIRKILLPFFGRFLLADVYRNSIKSVYEQHYLDPLHYITRLSLAWSSKYSTNKLDLITDPDMYLMIENNMRGGIATISHLYAQASNPLMQWYDFSKLNSWITYLDANNRYGTAM